METLPFNYTEKEKIKEVIFRQVEEVSRELRRKKLYTKTIAIILKNSSFQTYSIQTSLENQTNNTKEILQKAYELFENNYENSEIRLVGVRLANLSEKEKEQITLFSWNNEKQKIFNKR